ncbi:hypothetical protein Dimus_000354, partial [Dionaea muscipula]
IKGRFCDSRLGLGHLLLELGPRESETHRQRVDSVTELFGNPSSDNVRPPPMVEVAVHDEESTCGAHCYPRGGRWPRHALVARSESLSRAPLPARGHLAACFIARLALLLY